MQALTSSFPSSTRGHNRAQLDNIIFYSRPASANPHEITPIDADEWSDVDMIFAEASQQEWVAATEQLDQAGGFDIMVEDIQNAIDTNSTAWTAISTPAHLEDVSTPLCNPFDHSLGGIADRGGSVKCQEPLDVWGTQMESVPVGTPVTVQQNVQHNDGDVGIAVQDCPPDDGASIALWHAFRGEGSIPVPTTEGSAFPPRNLDTGEPNHPLHIAALLPGSPNIDMALSDKSLPEEGDRVQQPQLANDHERNSGSPTGEPSSTIGQEDTSRAAYDISANATPMNLQDIIDTTSATTGNDATIPESHVSVTVSAYPRCIIAAQLTPRTESANLCSSKSVCDPPENTKPAFDANASQANPSSVTQPYFEGSEEHEASTALNIEAMQSSYDGQIPCDSDEEDEWMPRKPPLHQRARVRSLANTQSFAETNRSPGALEMDCDEQEDDWPGVVQEDNIAKQRERSGEHHRASLDRACHVGNAGWLGQKKSDAPRIGKRETRTYSQNVHCLSDIETYDLRSRPAGRRGRPRKSNSQATGRYKAKRRPAPSREPLPRQPVWQIDRTVNELSALKAATPKSSRNKPTWTIDRIVGSTCEKGELFYRVRWDDTWEPAENLRGCADTAIAEFHLQHLL